MKSIKVFWAENNELMLIILLGLTPLLWFKGYLIASADVDFPFNPLQRFIQRLYVWNTGILGGTDRSSDISAEFFTSLQALFHNILGFDLITTEKLTFIFWFTLSGLSMYFLMSQLINHREIKERIMRITAVIFYMFNFYQVYAWEMAKIGELTGVVIIPSLLGLFIGGLEERISYKQAAMPICIFSIIASGTGFQPPMLGALFLMLILFFIFYLSKLIIRKDKENIFHSIRFSALFFLIFFLIAMFWIIPIGNFVLDSDLTSTSKAMEVYSSTNLLEYTSKYNGFLNIFRQFGQVFWFDSWGGELYNPYFQSYQTDAILIAFSFFIPILAFSAVLFSRNRYVIFFTFTTVIALFLGKGIHPPFGELYSWMFENIPGFWIYRAPWQKFGILIALGYSFLIGVACSKIYEYLQKHSGNYDIKFSLLKIKINFPILFIGLILLSNIIYTYPLVFGDMFPSSEGDVGFHQKFDLGYHINFPQYIFEASEWMNSNEEEFKIILLPDDRTNVYDWGFGGVGDISNQLFNNKGMLFRSYGEGYIQPRPIDNMHRLSINAIYNNLTPNTAKILGLLNVRYLLQRNDFRYDFYGDVDSPEFIESRLSFQKGIHLEKTFGKWDFYRNDYFVPHIYATTGPIYINGSIESLIPLVSDNDFSPQSVFFFSEILKEQNNFVLNISKYRTCNSSEQRIVIPVYNGIDKPIDWTMMADKYAARSYIGKKGIINVKSKVDPDMFVISSIKDSPYIFPSWWTPPMWFSINSTHIYIRNGSEPLQINGIYADGKPASDVNGIFWETGWMGMTTKEVTYPAIIPANQKVIIQINHLVNKTVTLLVAQSNKELNFCSFDNPDKYSNISDVFHTNQNNKFDITFQEINPTKYKVHVNTSKPFVLVFSESYDPQWKAYIEDKNSEPNDIIKSYENTKVKEAKHDMKFTPSDVSYLFKKSLPDENHFMANGYANSWYIDSQELSMGENFTVVLYFKPQSYFYIGLVISGITFISVVGYCIWNWRRNKAKKNDLL
ncbi:MAG: hypothetical protein O8C66_09035 [Candidatus Methanoperedens sp.]|nr:hypothetical protein [Candidatus Methanoperedens sp.]MCZ7370641.1 hypothetical protein [Candidatus Methanoperedens sp.]